MSKAPQNDSFLAALRGLRQSRRFLDKPVPEEAIESILEVARWTGSAKNTQPWEFIVVDDPETNRALAGYGAFTQFLDNVPLSIVIVLNGASPRSEAYDEGRVSERIMLAAAHLGLGSGTAWFSTEDAKAPVRELLGIPADRDVWSAVGIGYTDTSQQQASPSLSGRKPLQEIVSHGRYGQRNSQDV
jgi:nitroreductase